MTYNWKKDTNADTQEERDGLATTHEQVSDVYMEGTIDGVMNNVNGSDIPLKETKEE